jgi:hypothetical protein
MSRESNAAATRASKHTNQNHLTAERKTCILCRVLWPTLLEHRHLLARDSSEAETLLISTRQKT